MDRLVADIIDAHGGLDRWVLLQFGEGNDPDRWRALGLRARLIQDRNPRRMTVSLHEERAFAQAVRRP